jgi:hypothetical protein
MRSDSGCVYLLKGYRNEFLRFNTRADSWCSLQPAPAGVNVKWDKGSWIVSDGEHSIYAHKAKYHEFWRYDLVADSWIAAPLVAMPRTGSAGLKKTKEGSCAAWAGSAIYAFKGGNTQEFWLFMPGTNEWTELDTLPRYGSTMKNRKVKAGAGLACLDERVWALKGGKTREFWCYEPDTVVLARPGREGVQALPMAFVRGLALSICPNPAPRNTAVRLTCTWPPDARARLALYDAAGRRVSSFAVHRSSFAVRLAVPAGVYFVRLSAGPSLLARKLVIE